MLPLPTGALGAAGAFRFVDFSQNCVRDVVLSFTIDSTRRRLPCIKNLPTGNSRKPEKSGLFIEGFREYL